MLIYAGGKLGEIQNTFLCFHNGTKEMQDLYGMVNNKYIVSIFDEDSPFTLDLVSKSMAHLNLN